jgi:hypothetical protein
MGEMQMRTLTISQLQERLAECARLEPDAPVYVQTDIQPASALFQVQFEEHPDEEPALFLLGVTLSSTAE